MKKKNKKLILVPGSAKKYSKGVFLYLPRCETRKSLTEQINFIKSLPNVNHIEVWIEENLKPSDINFLKSSLARAERSKAKRKDEDLSSSPAQASASGEDEDLSSSPKNYEILIHAPWFHLSLISPHPEIRKTTVKLYLQTLKIADTLGAKLVTFHSGDTTIYISKETSAKMFIQNFKKIKSCYKGKSAFTVENVPAIKKGAQISHPGFPADLIYLKEKLPWLNFTLDIGHVLKEGKNLSAVSKFLKKYKNSVLNIHLHDAVLRGEDHLALGKGDLDFNKFFQILNKVGYAGYISLETISNEDTKKSWQKIYKL